MSKKNLVIALISMAISSVALGFILFIGINIVSEPSVVTSDTTYIRDLEREIEAIVATSTCSSLVELEKDNLADNLAKVYPKEPIEVLETWTTLDDRVKAITTTTSIPNISSRMLIGEPLNPNGRMMVVVHGLESSPEAIMGFREDYSNSIGKRLLDEGYVIIAPDLFNSWPWMTRAKFYLLMTDLTFESIIVAKVQAGLDLVPIPEVGIYGISYGSMVARSVGGLDDRLSLIASSQYIGDPAAMARSNVMALAPTWQVENPRVCNAGSLSDFGRMKGKEIIIESGTQDYHHYRNDELVDLLNQMYPGKVQYNKIKQGHSTDETDGILRMIDESFNNNN